MTLADATGLLDLATSPMVVIQNNTGTSSDYGSGYASYDYGSGPASYDYDYGNSATTSPGASPDYSGVRVQAHVAGVCGCLDRVNHALRVLMVWGHACDLLARRRLAPRTQLRFGARMPGPAAGCAVAASGFRAVRLGFGGLVKRQRRPPT